MRKFDNIMLGIWIMLIIVQIILLIYNISRNQQERVYLYGTHQADISFNNQKIYSKKRRNKKWAEQEKVLRIGFIY